TSMKTNKRRKQPTALMVIDIDHYKAFNDQYGHPAGDACLQALAKVMSAHFHHPKQLIARTGGEEFMAVLPNTSQETAVDSANRLRSDIEALGIPHSGKVVTISAGVACSTPATPLSAEQLIEAGDQALYAAKDSGRNQVITSKNLDWA
ncbi:MAG: GGDEF domain-containing protein, partial [Onishia taeanensis]|uniref:GGDEF domain-containing protein n=1 Tax=Onishia taeanensis TaxID=284577 RepID=UPI003C79D827